jgi:hypothetical protein
MKSLADRIKSLLAGGATVKTLTAAFGRHVAHVRATDADVAAKIDQLKTHEPFDLMGAAHHRTVAEQFKARWLPSRTAAASVARYNLESAIDPHDREIRSVEAECRRDVSRSFPDTNAAISTTRDGVLLAAILAEQVRATRGPELRAATPGARLRTYQDALNSPDDPRSPTLVTMIEQIIDAGDGATSDTTLPDAIALARHVRDVQDLRVPLELQEVHATVEQARKLLTTADRMQLRPANPAHEPAARAAFDAEAKALAGVGTE